jgi:hypothetical protein
MHLICLTVERQLGPCLKYVKGTLVFTEFGSILRGLSPYQAHYFRHEVGFDC